MAQPNDSSLSIPSGSAGGGPASRKAWKTGTDDPLRRQVFDKILQLCREVYQQKRRGPVPADWEETLPAWAGELESELYSGAATKEEYVDPVTFGSRLKTVAKRTSAIWRTQQRMREIRCQSKLSAVGNMMSGPKPGNISVSGVASGMMATSGSASTIVPTPETVDDSWMSLMEGLNLGAVDD